MGEIAFLDRPGGGTHVRISFDTERLAALVTAEPGPDTEDNDQTNEDA
jgi:two-component system nitrogen regulation sensor histidine kinase NtrY